MISLALSVLEGLLVLGYLASTQTPIPDQLDRLITLLAGGLIGVLASTRSTPDVADPPSSVVVANESDNPVPVDSKP